MLTEINLSYNNLLEIGNDDKKGGNNKIYDLESFKNSHEAKRQD